jgi:flagellar motor switch protein FliN/FliY
MAMKPSERPFNAGLARPGTSAGRSEVVAAAAEFQELGPGSTGAGGGSLDMLNDIPITLSATLGQTVLTIGDILKLGPGATIGLDREVSQPIDLMVGGKVFARGEVVVVNDRFAVRIKELSTPQAGGARESA